MTDHACKRATVPWEESKAGSKAPASVPAAKRYDRSEEMNPVVKTCYWTLAGASAYWMPEIILHWLLPENRLWIALLTVVAPTITFIVYVSEAKKAQRLAAFLPMSMLLGIWLTGPIAIAISIQPRGGQFLSPGHMSDMFMLWGWFPASTFVMSTYSGSLGGLTLITVALLLAEVIQIKRLIASNKAL